MDNEIKRLLDEEIKSEILNLQSLTPGEGTHSEAVDSLAQLYKLRIEELKIEADSIEKEAKRNADKEQNDRDADFKEKQLERECELKERQIDNEVSFHDSDEQFKKEQMRVETRKFWFDFGVNVGMGLLGIFAYNYWYHKGLKFEETGTVTSGMIRNLQSKMLPKA